MAPTFPVYCSIKTDACASCARIHTHPERREGKGGEEREREGRESSRPCESGGGKIGREEYSDMLSDRGDKGDLADSILDNSLIINN